MRLLSLSLSVTVYAVTTVLCAFMAGLGIGAAIAGRLAKRIDRPLFAYGVVEVALGIAACGQGRKVRFYRVTELITQLLEAREERRHLARKIIWIVGCQTTVINNRNVLPCIQCNLIIWCNPSPIISTKPF